MKITDNIITPEEGMFLTQASDEIEIMDRIVASMIALSSLSSPEEWKEISGPEALRIQEEQAAEVFPSTESPEEEVPDE